MSRTTSITPAPRDRDGMAVIGRTKQDLMGIRYGEGEVGGAPDPAAVAAAAQAAAAKAAEDAVKPPWGDDPTKFDPDKAWKLIQNVKSDLADQKTKTEAAIAAAATKAAEDAQKATLAQFAKLLGGGEQEETDPVKLAAKVTDLSTQIQSTTGELTKAQADIKAGQLSTAVAILSHGLGANPKLLLANEEFKTSIASVEPTDEAAIQAAITKAIQANAALKATPPRSGSGEHQGATVQSLEALLAQAVKAGDVGEQITIKRRIAEVKAKE